MGATIMSSEEAQELLKALEEKVGRCQGQPETPEEKVAQFAEAVKDWLKKLDNAGPGNIHHLPPEQGGMIVTAVQQLLGALVATGVVTNVMLQYEVVKSDGHTDAHTVGVCTGRVMAKFCKYALEALDPGLGFDVALKYIRKVARGL